MLAVGQVGKMLLNRLTFGPRMVEIGGPVLRHYSENVPGRVVRVSFDKLPSVFPEAGVAE